MSHRWIAVVTTGLAVASLAGCGKREEAGAARGGPRAFPVSAQPVESRRLVYAVGAVGSLEAREVVTVPARVSGVIESVGFEEGDAVTRATVLAVIDGERFSLDAEQVRAGIVRQQAAVESARSRTAGARAALTEALTSLERRRALREKNPGWVTEEEISSQEAQAARLEAALGEALSGEGQAEAALEEARARLAVAEKDLSDCRVRPPVDGVVERKHVSAGQFIREGDAVATLVDTSLLRLRFRVTETESVQLRPGLVVSFEAKPFPGRRFEARLYHVNATADAATRMVECVAEVDKPDPALRPGFFASVRAEVGSSAEAIVVPEAALLPTERGFVVFVVAGGRASVRPVRLGLHTRDGSVEVLEGLTAGEVIAVDGARALEDGVPVRVIEGDGGKGGAAPAAPGAAGR